MVHRGLCAGQCVPQACDLHNITISEQKLRSYRRKPRYGRRLTSDQLQHRATVKNGVGIIVASPLVSGYESSENSLPICRGHAIVIA